MRLDYGNNLELDAAWYGEDFILTIDRTPDNKIEGGQVWIPKPLVPQVIAAMKAGMEEK